MAETNNGEYTILSDEQITFSKRGFCATLSQDGTQSLRSDTIEDFLPMIEQSSLTWVDYIVEDVKKNAAETAAKLGFTKPLINRLLSKPRSGYEDFDTEMGIIVPSIRVKGFDVKLEPLLLLMKKNLILTLHTSETKRFYHIRRYAEVFFKKLPMDLEQNDRLTLVLLRIIDDNNSKNFENLQEIEECGDDLSRDLANNKTSRVLLGERIYHMKHALITYLSGLWATADTLYELRYGDADLISNNQRVLDKIGLMVNEVHSHIGLAEHLSEVLASGLEVVQSIYNNQLQILNNRLSILMGYLAIIGTALLVPNTIGTVMSQTNIFQFTPADTGWYIGILAGSTIIATIVAWLLVKRMRLLPTRPDEDQ